MYIYYIIVKTNAYLLYSYITSCTINITACIHMAHLNVRVFIIQNLTKHHLVDYHAGLSLTQVCVPLERVNSGESL